MGHEDNTPKGSLENESASVRGPLKTHRGRRWVLWIVGVFILGLILWAFLSPASRHLVVTGKVISVINRIVIRHVDGGVVSKIYVKNGSRVKEGQILVQLDEREVKLNLTLLQDRIHELAANKARLLAERDNEEKIKFPEHLVKHKHKQTVAELLKNQKSLFVANIDSYNNQLDIFKRRIEQLRLQIQGLQAQLKANEEQYKIVLQEMKEVQALYEKKLIDLPRLLALKREKVSLEGDRGEKVSELATLKQKIGETEYEIIMLRVARRKEVLKELLETHKQLIDVRRKEVIAKNTLEKTSIRSPQDGVVADLQVKEVGASVKPGEPLMEIIPAKEILLIDVNIRHHDIDAVYPGQVAKVKFTGLKMDNVPVLLGKVTHVSSDAFKIGGQSYYLVRVEITKKQLNRLQLNQAVEPGMPVSVMLGVGAKTFMGHIYFLIKKIF